MSEWLPTIAVDTALEMAREETFEGNLLQATRRYKKAANTLATEVYRLRDLLQKAQSEIDNLRKQNTLP